MPEPRPVVLTAAQVRTALAGGAVELRRKLRPADWLMDGDPIRGTVSEMDTTRWHWRCLNWHRARLDDEFSAIRIPGGRWLVPLHSELGATTHRLYPLIRPGDRLWVREEHLLATRDGHKPFISFLRENPGAPPGYPLPEGFGKWRCEVRPASKMPRWASRLTLVVTGLRLEPGEERPFVMEARRDG